MSVAEKMEMRVSAFYTTYLLSTSLPSPRTRSSGPHGLPLFCYVDLPLLLLTGCNFRGFVGLLVCWQHAGNLIVCWNNKFLCSIKHTVLEKLGQLCGVLYFLLFHPNSSTYGSVTFAGFLNVRYPTSTDGYPYSSCISLIAPMKICFNIQGYHCEAKSLLGRCTYKKCKDDMCLMEVLKRLASENISQRRNAMDVIAEILHISLASKKPLPHSAWQETANTLLERLGDNDIWIREQTSKLLPMIGTDANIEWKKNVYERTLHYTCLIWFVLSTPLMRTNHLLVMPSLGFSNDTTSILISYSCFLTVLTTVQKL
ncbi:hypothetical protein P8452_66810 [Trifolium repens]|nr:hypothetical protein P8452_66810 [Trifolium repens]